MKEKDARPTQSWMQYPRKIAVEDAACIAACVLHSWEPIARLEAALSGAGGSTVLHGCHSRKHSRLSEESTFKASAASASYKERALLQQQCKGPPCCQRSGNLIKVRPLSSFMLQGLRLGCNCKLLDAAHERPCVSFTWIALSHRAGRLHYVQAFIALPQLGLCMSEATQDQMPACVQRLQGMTLRQAYALEYARKHKLTRSRP